jgi:hypothetical protein
MAGFPQAVADMQTFWRGQEDVDYLVSPERQREAEQVAACAARWVEGEMDPSGRLTVARGPSVGALGAPPSLAEKLGAKLERRDDDDRAAAAFAVHKALAVGYLAFCEPEERANVSVLADRRPEDIWEYWVANCRTMLENSGIPASWAKMVRGMGRSVLITELRELKLTRYLGGLETQSTRPPLQPSWRPSPNHTGRQHRRRRVRE